MKQELKNKNKNNIQSPFIPNSKGVSKIKDDFFNSKKTAEELKKDLERFMDTDSSDESAFGLFGIFGIGKSSIIEHIEYLNNQNLNSDYDIKIINLLKHENGDSFLESISSEIIYNLSVWKWFCSKINYAKIAFNFSVLFKKVNFSINFSKKDKNMIKSLIWNLHKYKKTEKNNKNTKGKKTKILFIFDEIDRCKKENVISFFNFLKYILLSLPSGVSFSLIMDKEYINNYILSKKDYKLDGKLKETSYSDFIDKIVIHSFEFEKHIKANKEINFLDGQEKLYDLNILKTPREYSNFMKIFNFYFEKFASYFQKIKEKLNPISVNELKKIYFILYSIVNSEKFGIKIYYWKLRNMAI